MACQGLEQRLRTGVEGGGVAGGVAQCQPCLRVPLLLKSGGWRGGVGAKSGSCSGRGLRKRLLCAQEEAAMRGPVRATSLQEARSVSMHDEDASGHSQSPMGTTAPRAPSRCPVSPPSSLTRPACSCRPRPGLRSAKTPGSLLGLPSSLLLPQIRC